MKTFNSLNSDFRMAFIEASKNGRVRFTIEGLKDDPDAIYPMIEVTHKHVTYYNVDEQSSICITDKNLMAVIY